ncbi:MAG: hypothetical protein P1Q69_06535 [Candidatus Thorarchaeota archaeon]|nr:hypothetical protein [Candidatus Thorarchaeota archaeon]
MQIGDSIKGIKITKEGKREQKQAVFLTDPQKAIELDHPVRRAIIQILSRGIPDRITVQSTDPLTNELALERVRIERDILSVTEIVRMSEEHLDILTITRNQVNHHLQKMIDEEFLIHFGTLTTGKRTTDYYRRVAKQYVITMETPNLGEDFLRKRETGRLQRTLGLFNIELSKEEINELIEIRVKLELMQDKWRTKIAGMIQNDVTDPEITDTYHWMLEAYSIGSDEYLKLFRRFREILFGEMEDE